MTGSMPAMHVIAVTIIWGLGSFMGIEAADQSDLVWTDVRQSVVTPFGAAEIQANFYYSNHGLLPITIDLVTSTCSCTSGYGAGDVCPPGHSGAIHVIITTETLLGAQDRLVSVTYHSGDDREHPRSMELHTVTTIANTDGYASWDRRFLHWELSAAAVSQACTFTVHQEHPIHLLTCQCLGEGFIASLHEIRPGQVYSVTVTPKDTRSSHWAHVILTSDAELPVLRRCELVALVMSLTRPGPP